MNVAHVSLSLFVCLSVCAGSAIEDRWSCSLPYSLTHTGARREQIMSFEKASCCVSAVEYVHTCATRLVSATTGLANIDTVCT